MTNDAGRAAGTRTEFRTSRAKRVHGLLIAGVLALVGLGALIAAGPVVPDGRLIGAINLALAGGVAVYVLRTASNSSLDMVLDDDGIWFRDWNLPPVPWRHVVDASAAGSHLRPMIRVKLREAEFFFAQLDETAPKRRRANPLVHATDLMVPGNALDAPLDDILAAIREGMARAGE